MSAVLSTVQGTLATDATPGADPELVASDVRRALDEDLGTGDRTADLVPADAQCTAELWCREAAVLAGRAWFEACFRALDADTAFDWKVTDGDQLSANSLLCVVQGAARAILSAERSALNFLQTLSGTATITRGYVNALAKSHCRLLDTRKTLPGLRYAQKYAVRCGGGVNHRMGLYDAILIKENHIRAAGSIALALAQARRLHPDISIEVEVENLDELEQALAGEAPRVLLDEFSLEDLKRAVTMASGRCELEVSGSVDLARLSDLADLGVDYVSVGALTKHVRAIDLSLRLV